MSGEAERPADRGQRPPLRVIRPSIEEPGGRRRPRPGGEIARMLTTDAELMQRLLAVPADEIVMAVGSRPDAVAFWDVVERILRRRLRAEERALP